MELSYETEELRDYVRFPAKAVERYGQTAARSLAVRFADLRALERASDLVALGAQECIFGEAQAMRVPISNDHVLVLVANHPKKKGQPLEWANVNRVKIVKIGKNDE